MTIGFDGSRAFSTNRTGTENYSFQLLKALSKIDSNNQYIIYLRPASQVDRAEWPQNFKFKILNFKRLWTQLGLGLQTSIDPLDVLFVPAHTLPIIRKPSLKTVMTVHDLGAEYLPSMHQLKQRLYLNWMTHHQLKSATKLIAVSESTKNDLISTINLPSKNIQVIYEATNLKQNISINLDTKRDILNKFDIKDREYFIFIGTIQPRKNLERVIKAFKAFLDISGSNTKLVLAGSKGWLSEDIYLLPKSLSIEKNIIFTGRVSEQELEVLLSSGLALVYPSLFEGFGLPILEAFARNLPVITSNSSSMPEVAGNAAILVDPEKTEQILEAMLKISSDDKLRQELIKKGQTQLEKFSWQKCAKETLELFKQL